MYEKILGGLLQDIELSARRAGRSRLLAVIAGAGGNRWRRAEAPEQEVTHACHMR